MVNVDATLSQALDLGLISNATCHELAEVARGVFFKDRTWKRVAHVADMDWDVLRVLVDSAWVDQKRCDAIRLLDAMNDPSLLSREPQGWSFNTTPLWRRMYR